ncbi:unnamed protein product [Arctia plantaginis]|uniref:Syndecan n=1 Tax=Arctia plantaginis TaxID=874455 RepID=A0A8S1A4B7_ARCPL|nr:unnamed protein product [Arctia plantaginis]CAB3240220.1 unnamed protein product [Arctia plantaginis]
MINIELDAYLYETDAVAEKPTEESIVPVQNDVQSQDRDLFIDDADDGSGLDADESSGSGWGAGGPGLDDEDGRPGSGELPNGPPDDEDYGTPTQKTKGTESTLITIGTPRPEETDYVDPEQPEIPDVPNADPIPSVDSNQLNEIIPKTANRPVEGPPVQGRDGGAEQPPRPDQTDFSITGEDLVPSVDQQPSGTSVNSESRVPDKVFIMNTKSEDRAASFFAQPGILAAVIGGAVVGLLCAILVVMFIVYRMRKKDEGSYALDEPKRSPAAASYGKGHNNREFYA